MPKKGQKGDEIQINFTQNPIPELFGVVKDEHKVPALQYQDNMYQTSQSLASNSMQYKSQRLFQMSEKRGKPAPNSYVIPQFEYDGESSPIKGQRPLTKQRSHNTAKRTFTREPRNTIFSGKYKLYETQFKFANEMGKNSNEPNPGPKYDTSGKPYSFQGTVKGSFS